MLSQWLAVCVPFRALIFAVVCPAVLCGSLPWTDHCFGHHISSLLAPLSFVDHCLVAYFAKSGYSCSLCDAVSPNSPQQFCSSWPYIGLFTRFRRPFTFARPAMLFCQTTTVAHSTLTACFRAVWTTIVLYFETRHLYVAISILSTPVVETFFFACRPIV